VFNSIFRGNSNGKIVGKTILLFLIVLFSHKGFSKTKIYLSSKVYSEQSYTDLYKKQGALVRNIDFESVHDLIKQVNEFYGIKLSDRGEAHITTITPPEYSNDLSSLISSDEIHSMFKNKIQNTTFKIHCVGERKSNDGKRVFFLVVESSNLFELRNELKKVVNARAEKQGTVSNFQTKNFWPHITIGYIHEDVHGVSKGPETCIKEFELVIQ
jgi:2'-5' RNA ligase